MRIALGLMMSALLASCSQPLEPRDEGRQAAAAAPRSVEMRSERPVTVTDAEGNEFDPEVADAVREQMELREMERQEAGEGEGGDWGDGG